VSFGVRAGVESGPAVGRDHHTDRTIDLRTIELEPAWLAVAQSRETMGWGHQEALA
jgi:hypothetical protein